MYIYVYVGTYIYYIYATPTPPGYLPFLGEDDRLGPFPGLRSMPAVAPALRWNLKVIRRDSCHKCVPKPGKPPISRSLHMENRVREANIEGPRLISGTRVAIHDTCNSCS